MNGFASIIAVTGLALSLSTTGAAGATTWDFDTPGTPGQAPAGWSDASQALTPYPSAPGPYQLTTFDSKGVILFKTEAGTSQRPKIRTNQTMTTGIYKWRVFIPEKEANARVSTGAFLYSDQSGAAANAAREIDFEIGPGRQSVRNGIANLPSDALLVYLTVQPDNAAGRSGDPGSSLVFQPADPANHLFPDEWYTLTLELAEDAQGRYVVDWYIQRDGGARLKARSTYTTAYGPSNAHPTSFRTYASLENLNFMGDALPTRDHFVYFDSVQYIDSACIDAITEPQLISDMESDTTAAGFPPGAPGEWTRFGAAYQSLALTTDPAEVDAGNVSLAAQANFTETNYGIRYNIPGGPIDTACAEVITWRMRIDDADGSFVRFVVQEADGDIWVTADEFPATENWETYTTTPGNAAFVLAQVGGDAQWNNSIAFVGFDMRPAIGTTNTPTFFFDEIYWGLTEYNVAPEPRGLPVLSDMEEPDFTTGAFPPDTSSPTFPDSAEPGEWTRFGAAYNGMDIIENPGEAAEGNRYMAVHANWSAGSRVGIRFIPYTGDSDWTGYNSVTAEVRSLSSSSATTVQLALFEADGDIWITAPIPPIGTAWEGLTFSIPHDLILDTEGGDGLFSGDEIILFGFNFDNTASSSTETILVDNIRLDVQASGIMDAFLLH